MFQDYKILIHKYRYDSATELSEVNYFSTATKTLEQTLDLTPYVIDNSPVQLESNSIRIEEKITTPTIRRMSSNIELEITDLNDDMNVFFEIYEDTSYLLYLVELIPIATNLPIWKGILKQESIEELLEDSNGSDEQLIIKLTIASYDSEFKDYFNNKKLNDVDVPWTVCDSGLSPAVSYRYWTGSNKYITYGLVSTLFTNLLDNIFHIPLDIEYSISTYWVSQNGFLTRRDAQGIENFVYIKTGYNRITDGEETCWGFLEKLCNSMGWDFYFWNGLLRIENRYKQTIANAIDISVNDFEHYTVKKDKAEQTFEHIIINDGEVILTGTGDSDRKKYEGSRVRYLKNEGRYTHIDHFDYLVSNNRPALLSGNISTKFQTMDDDYYRLMSLLYETISGGSRITYYPLNIPLDSMLSINSGNTGVYMVAYNEKNGYNFLYEKGSPILGGVGDEFAFSGNYGNCLFKVESNRIVTYQEYCKSDLFLQNFAPLLYSKAITLRLTGKYNEEIFDYEKINIIDDDNLAGSYIIDKFKTDIENETTDLELIKLNQND